LQSGVPLARGYIGNFKILKFWRFPQIEKLENILEVIAIYNIWKQIRLESKKTYILGE
jgi:hypothetical protein